jgi:hypothetical protein
MLIGLAFIFFGLVVSLVSFFVHLYIICTTIKRNGWWCPEKD